MFKRSRLFKDTMLELAKNVAMGVPFIRNLRLARPRTSLISAHTQQDLERYAFGVVHKVIKYKGAIVGRHVTEIGPGDHLATGLSMIAAGASSYTSIDRFSGPYGNEYAKGWYRAVKAAWPAAFPEIAWPEWLDVEKFPNGFPDRVRVIPAGVEEVKGEGGCDIVCSHFVAEHVLNLDDFARVTEELLAAGGVAIHIVDFSQHHEWTYYNDPFLFLRFPEWLWNLMGSNRGLPNRFRFHEYVTAFEAAGLRVECDDRVIAAELVNPSSLAKRFRKMPMDSIKTLKATFVCSKQ